MALGTGNGVASGATVTQDGRTLLDSHGITIARRGFQRLLSNYDKSMCLWVCVFGFVCVCVFVLTCVCVCVRVR